jgi:hypothetical protein
LSARTNLHYVIFSTGAFSIRVTFSLLAKVSGTNQGSDIAQSCFLRQLHRQLELLDFIQN